MNNAKSFASKFFKCALLEEKTKTWASIKL